MLCGSESPYLGPCGTGWVESWRRLVPATRGADIKYSLVFQRNVCAFRERHQLWTSVAHSQEAVQSTVWCECTIQSHRANSIVRLLTDRRSILSPLRQCHWGGVQQAHFIGRDILRCSVRSDMTAVRTLKYSSSRILFKRFPGVASVALYHHCPAIRCLY